MSQQDKNSFNCEFGARLAQLRSKRDWTRAHLAELVDISDRFVYDLESGRKSCTSEILLRLAQALNVSADYLLTGTDPAKHRPYEDILRKLWDLPPESLPYLEKMVDTFYDCIQEIKQKGR